MDENVVEVGVVDGLGAGGCDGSAVDRPRLARGGAGVEVGDLPVGSEAAGGGQDGVGQGGAHGGEKGRAAVEGERRGAVGLDLVGGDARQGPAQQEGDLAALRGGEVLGGVAQSAVGVGDLDEAPDDELVHPGGSGAGGLEPVGDEGAQQAPVVLDARPGSGAAGGLEDDGGAVVEVKAVAGGGDVSDEGSDPVVGAAGAVPGGQAAAGDGEQDSADGVGEDVGLGGEVDGAAAGGEAPPQGPVVPDAVGPGGQGTGEDGACPGPGQGGEVPGLRGVASAHKEDPPAVQTGERPGHGLRMGAGDRLDVGTGTGQEAAAGGPGVSGADDEEAEGQRAHEPSTSVSLGGPQWLTVAVERISALEISQVWVGAALRRWTKPKRVAE